MAGTVALDAEQHGRDVPSARRHDEMAAGAGSKEWVATQCRCGCGRSATRPGNVPVRDEMDRPGLLDLGACRKQEGCMCRSYAASAGRKRRSARVERAAQPDDGEAVVDGAIVVASASRRAGSGG